MENRREIYRVDLSSESCTVEARFEDRIACGMGIELDTRGLGATFETEPPALLPLVGEVGRLVVAGEWLKGQIELEAQAVRRSDIDAGVCLFGFDFLASADEVEPKLRRIFDPRQTARFRPPLNEPVEVVIGTGPDLSETATLRNISFTGVGLQIDVSQERRLGNTSEVELQLPLSSSEEPLTVPAAIRHRHFIGPSRVVIGLVFLLPDSTNPTQRAIDDYVMTLQRRDLVNAAQVREPSSPQ
jgi:hypothetical protein